MGTERSIQILDLEDRLSREFNAEAEFPPDVPEEIRLTLLERAYRELNEKEKDPEEREMESLFGPGQVILTFCGGWCPDCEILSWCRMARESHSEEDLRWMKEHNDYPPEDPT